MGYKEKEKINEVLLEGTKKGRMFRVNAGQGFQGTNLLYSKKYKNKISKINTIFNTFKISLIRIGVKLKNITILFNTRIFHGVPAGVHDIIGWESIEVCEWLHQQMNPSEKQLCQFYKNKINDKNQCVVCPFHKKIAVFKSVEVKPKGEDLTDKQRNFRQQILKDGGISEVAYYEK